MEAHDDDRSDGRLARRILVVANQTLGGRRVLEWLRDQAEQGPCSVHVLIPANVDTQHWVHDDDSDRELAQARLAECLQRFRELDVTVTGEVGDPRPMDAILDVLNREAFDEILVSTLPVGISRWLRFDLVHRLQRTVLIPVTHLIAEPEHARAR